MDTPVNFTTEKNLIIGISLLLLAVAGTLTAVVLSHF
jgi:hypothetical protein